MSTLFRTGQHLHKSHRKRYRSHDRRGRIKNAISIDERPPIVDKKMRIGGWEGDTIIGKDRKSALYTLVERKTRDGKQPVELFLGKAVGLLAA